MHYAKDQEYQFIRNPIISSAEISEVIAENICLPISTAWVIVSYGSRNIIIYACAMKLTSDCVVYAFYSASE